MRARASILNGPETYDAIVVGSGISGGIAAKELTEKGLKTLVLERGRNVEHSVDYVTEEDRPWDVPFRGETDRRKMQEEQYVQSQAGPVNESNAHFFVNDRENPYTLAEDSDFLWIRGHQVGGRSLTWGRQCYRLSDLDLKAASRDGHGIDWPIDYDELAPWYGYVEDYVGISGQAEGIPHLPDSNFLPPMNMNCVEQDLRAGIEDNFPGRTMTIGRTAMLTQPHNGRGACQYRNLCSRGCSYGAYYSSQVGGLRSARETGNMTLRPHSIVTEVLYDAETGRARGVRVIDAETEETVEFHARLVFLCASALGSTRILLNSTSTAFPNGLANSSGVLGHYLMDHPFKAGAFAEMPGYEDQYYHGRRANGIYIPRFRNIGDDQQDGFLRGYGYQGGASRAGWARGIGSDSFGVDFKESLREPGPWSMYLLGFGEMLPRYENYVELDPEVTDRWGQPVLRFHASLSENEQNMRQDMAEQAAEMLEACGGTNVTPFLNDYAVGEGIHEMGTARMGADPETSVLNGRNQAHDVPNLFVTDGACMTSAGCQNPSLTYMALTARAVDYAVAQVNNGTL
ncbi:MAG: GMC family oxidoreductase [Bacteroidetes bacterium]|jgi:choline dehydrogenase-like flavoprotein|nr:GMC family oxidoreductase [Bacteroidota bacterium]